MSGFVFADPTEVKLDTAEDAELMGAERDFQQARELFNQGKTTKAVDLFSTSLEIRTKHFGKENVSLADHYRLYGEALLELVKNQADPFGGMIKQTVEEKAEKLLAEADDGEDVDDDEESGDEEAADEGEKKEGEENATEKKEDANNNNEEGDDEGDDEEGDEDEDEEGDDDDEDEAPQEDPEQLLEIAWECLENARVLSEKAERWIAASDAIICLGDIALEGSQLEAAIADYQRALELREKHLEDSNDRRIAEAHFQLALAHSLTQDGREKAREHYTKARDILVANVAALKSKPAESTNSNANNNTEGSSESSSEKVKELEQLIEELNEKIDDEGIKEDEALPDLPPLPDLVPVPLSSTTGFAAPTNPSGPVNNLGVVKRKNPNARKVTPEAVPSENKESEANRGLKRKSDEITPDPNENTDPNTVPTKKLKESAEVAPPAPAPLS